MPKVICNGGILRLECITAFTIMQGLVKANYNYILVDFFNHIPADPHIRSFLPLCFPSLFTLTVLLVCFCRTVRNTSTTHVFHNTD